MKNKLSIFKICTFSLLTLSSFAQEDILKKVERKHKQMRHSDQVQRSAIEAEFVVLPRKVQKQINEFIKDRF